MKSISVIIPTFNGEDFISEALDSIQNQTYPVNEIIVVDDGSTDNTISIIKNSKVDVKLIEQPHRGNPVYGRNIGIKNSDSEFIAFLDQDDLWPENKLELQVNNLMKYPEAKIDVGMTKSIMEQNENNKTLFANRIKETEQYFLLSSGLFRKEVFEEIGLFDETLKFHGSDFDWILRVAENELMFNLHNEKTLLYRIHENNFSNDQVKIKLGVVEVFRKSMMRRKLKGQKGFSPLPELRNTNKK